MQRTCNLIEKILRQLEAQGETINSQRMLIQLLLSKFPIEVIFQLEKSKEPTSPWTMETLRRAISQYMTVQENVYRHVTNVRGHFDHQQEPVYHNDTNVRGHSEEQHSSNSSAEVFSNFSDNRNTRVYILRPCIFCKGDHYNDECDKFITLSERKQKLSQQRKCFIYLKSGHVLKDCPTLRKRSCNYCGKRGYHNRCLCPEKFPDQGTETFCITEPSNPPILLRNSSDSQSNTLPGNSFSEIVVESQQSTNASITQTLLASGERVLLQTAIVPIQSSDGNNVINARVLLDSASQRTFMTNKLAQRLKLPSEHKEHLSVSTFGAKKATDIDTYVVNFKVQIKDGSYMLLSANVLKQITGSIQRSPL